MYLNKWYEPVVDNNGGKALSRTYSTAKTRKFCWLEVDWNRMYRSSPKIAGRRELEAKVIWWVLP